MKTKKQKTEIIVIDTTEKKKIICEVCKKCIDEMCKGTNNDVKLMAICLVELCDSFKDATGIDTKKYVLIEKEIKK